MKDDANWCEKTKHTVRARTYCLHAFGALPPDSTASRALRVTTPLNAVGVQTPCITGMAAKSAAYRLGETPGG